MKKVFLILMVLIICLLGIETSIAQFGTNQVGKVHYMSFPLNNKTSKRNRKIAKACNKYIKKHTSQSFPDILLYLTELVDPPPVFLISYTIKEMEILGEYYESGGFSFNKKHIEILIDVPKSELKTRALKAVDYAVNNLSKLIETYEYLLNKKKNGTLTEEDEELLILDFP